MMLTHTYGGIRQCQLHEDSAISETAASVENTEESNENSRKLSASRIYLMSIKGKIPMKKPAVTKIQRRVLNFHEAQQKHIIAATANQWSTWSNSHPLNERSCLPLAGSDTGETIDCDFAYVKTKNTLPWANSEGCCETYEIQSHYSSFNNIEICSHYYVKRIEKNDPYQEKLEIMSIIEKKYEENGGIHGCKNLRVGVLLRNTLKSMRQNDVDYVSNASFLC